jgi:hypothetical protein
MAILEGHDRSGSWPFRFDWKNIQKECWKNVQKECGNGDLKSLFFT